MKATENTENTEHAELGHHETSLIHGHLTEDIRQVAFEVHKYFGYGFLEKVYENCLAHRLRKRGHAVVQQAALSVRDYDGTLVGEYFADLVINGLVLIEIKAVPSLRPEHQAQILHYLKTTGLHVGMLVNFGRPRLQVRRFTL